MTTFIVGKTISKRFAGPDDPIYSGGLQTTLHNRFNKSDTSYTSAVAGETQAILPNASSRLS